ncbi:MAG: rane-fusion protein, partial [Microbacterium sp.]|nr:rane-fusion protein [Microbacterium sp.]
TVWVSTADGATEERPVALGLTDGTQVEITQGLTEGEEVLEFAPGAMAGSGAGDNCTTYPDGTMFCESVPAS